MDREEERLLYKIAKLYYEEDYTQAEISSRLGIYRTTIGRMLKKARKEGIVKITVQSQLNEQIQLEEEISEHFDMKEVIIVPSSENDNRSGNEEVGKATTKLLNRVIRDDDTIGSAWGTTLGTTVNQLHDLNSKNVTCVPLVGGPGEMEVDFHVNAIVYKLAQAFNGESHFIDAAAVHQSKETAQEILNSNYMNKILDLWEQLSVAIVGIGTQLKSSNLIWSGFLGQKDQKELEAHHTIGDICSRFYTLGGESIASPISERTIAVKLEKLQNLRYSIGIAYSKEKAKSIIGAMRGNFINTLVTDEETAFEIKRLIEEG
ncbi:sugar-binding transcriptional regulator [Lentibacillus sp.]|uniref:sugar-binding transcriptional regulator n=1 Tax=Lentibacillus sp. TaxID=1925746 RepID=UPI002B4B0C5C|nr:sugar-binding transcriptional regulator [Lentibacillus sp.]HLS08305.1 sugar-binding transcriptional regulator [Lentibacillus sp.]